MSIPLNSCHLSSSCLCCCFGAGEPGAPREPQFTYLAVPVFRATRCAPTCRMPRILAASAWRTPQSILCRELSSPLRNSRQLPSHPHDFGKRSQEACGRMICDGYSRYVQSFELPIAPAPPTPWPPLQAAEYYLRPCQDDISAEAPEGSPAGSFVSLWMI